MMTKRPFFNLPFGDSMLAPMLTTTRLRLRNWQDADLEPFAS